MVFSLSLKSIDFSMFYGIPSRSTDVSRRYCSAEFSVATIPVVVATKVVQCVSPFECEGSHVVRSVGELPKLRVSKAVCLTFLRHSRIFRIVGDIRDMIAS